MASICNAVGDIDRATAPAFDAELRDTIDRAEEALVCVDCSGVTFMDPAGYRVLVGATQYAVRRGHTLVIRNMSRACTRLVQLCDDDLELRIELQDRERSVQRPPAREAARPVWANSYGCQ